MSRLPQPIPKHGPVKGRCKERQAANRIKVFFRCKGRCEGCGRLVPKLEWAHIFGRRQIVGEPYASSPELTMGLCRYDPMTNQVGCHEKIDRYLDKALRDRLEVEAAKCFYKAHKVPYPKTLNPAGAVRKLAAKLDKLA